MLLFIAAALATPDLSAIRAVETCRAEAAARRPCETIWHDLRIRLDTDFRGTLRASEGSRSVTWQVTCPYDVIHRSGGCALVAKGIMFIKIGKRDVPVLSWGDHHAERRERMVTVDDGRSAEWNDEMTADDARALLALLEGSRRATFRWRPARSKMLVATTLDLVAFADTRVMLAAIADASIRAHEGR